MSYDAIYLSPHLDDAVLSCGGQIYRFLQSGQRVLVVTLLTGEPEGELSPVAEELHRTWGLEAPFVAPRRREDEAACRVLGVEFVHSGLLDALYRVHPESGEPVYPRLGMIFSGKPDPDDDAHLDALAAYLAELPSAARVCAPLGVGRHVDHVLVRRAAERVFGGRLELYEDYPYVQKRWALWKARGLPLGWHSRTWPLGHDALDAKCRAIRCYTSQVGMLFGGEDEVDRQVRRYAWRIGGERLWWRDAGSRGG